MSINPKEAKITSLHLFLTYRQLFAVHLTSIKLAGFKSFVDPTTISVPGQLVAVVGPNGCGKSNVIDAVRWVLGESSAKQLRGQSMQDVIFNGAASRKSVSRASVELIFNNSDHKLQGSWGQFAEVSIKRTLTRQGDSAYYINQQVVRRKDITDLFLGTGVGARGYAVIEQGMISRIIEARPEELRAYIEEAAGVSKYKERRRETENRLKDTRDNLSRLSDLQSELTRQIEKLERQAKTASDYKTLKTTIDHKQNLLSFARLGQAQASAKQAALLCSDLRLQETELENTLQSINQESYQLQLKEHDQQQKLHQTQNQWALIREKLARLEEQIRHHQDLKERVEKEKLQANVQISQISQQQKEITTALQSSEDALTEKQMLLDELHLASEETQLSVPDLEEQFSQQESVYLSQNEKINQLKREHDLATQKHSHLQQLQSTLKERQLALMQENKELGTPTQVELQEVQDIVSQHQYASDTLNQEIEATEQTLSKLQAALSSAQQSYHQLNGNYLGLNAQFDALSSLLKNHDDNDAFWQTQKLEAALPLWQHIEVDPKWQHALAVFLGERLNAREGTLLSVETRPNNHATLIIPNEKKSTFAQNSLRAQIQAKAPFDNALDDWLNHVSCAQNLQAALSSQASLSSQECLITPEGDAIYANSIVLFGHPNEENQLSRQSKINQLSAQLNEIKPQLEDIQVHITQTQTSIETQQRTLAEQKNQLKTQNEALKQAHLQETKLLERAKHTQIRATNIENEHAKLEIEQEQNALTLETLLDSIETLEAGLRNLEEDHQRAQEIRAHTQNTLKTARLQVLEANRQLGLEQLNEQKLKQQIEHFQQQLIQLNNRHDEVMERQSELAFEFENGDENQEQQFSLNHLLEEQEAIETSLNEIRKELEQTQNQNKHLSQKHQQTAQNQPKIQHALQQGLLQEQEATLLSQRFLDELKDRQADLEKLRVDAVGAGSLEILSKEIIQLSQKIEGLGAINLAALEELSEASERGHYLLAQIEDLNQAIGALETAITQIDDESNMLFKQTFDTVNEKMKSIFPTLFGGGQAMLEIVGDDLLNAGISIMAHPPGKKNSTIHLLSGGEKALTAMSLVFALFSLNPAPFCLLDEVDAPLDDANTSRFCLLVKEMSANTQFLYISHNRLTMEMAEQLIGVTMQEKGVSRIVAVDIKEALTMREGAEG